LANRSADFNYKVALAEGLKKLQAGRLRQAEEQFRYLVKHFPSAEGGYRGLAKVLVEQEDRSSAMRMLLDGGAALAKAGNRESAIAVYKEAVALDGNDLGAHRRLAAALMLAGDQEGAAHEYVRYINNAVAGNDIARAKSEAAYALERLGGNREVAAAARSAGADVPVMPVAPPEDRAALMKSTFGMDLPPADAMPMAPQRWDGPIPEAPPPQSAKEQKSSWDAPPPLTSTHGRAETVLPARAVGESDPWASTDAAAQGAAMPSAGEAVPADADASTVEAQAAKLIASGDPRGGEHAIEAARRYIAEGHIDAASDLLLQLVAKGVAGHDAQRLLIDVTKSLGKNEMTKTKMKLLVEALKLDGRAELAAEVEQQAQAS